LLGCDGVPDLAATVSSQKAFYSSVRSLLLGPDKAELEGLLLGRSGVESASLLLDRGDACYSAMTKPSRKLFYSATVTSPTW